MSLLCKDGDELSSTNSSTKLVNTQFNLNTAINQRRIIVVKFPYSDMNNVPSQVCKSEQYLESTRVLPCA